MELTDSASRARHGAGLLSRLVFFALPVAYALSFARYWLSDVDEGFLLGNAWRVVNGQLPYRDFIYVRPPLPVLLQALPLLLLPETLPLIAGRVYFYAGVAVYSFVASDLLVRAFGARAGAIDRWLLAAAAFVFSAHDFPAMPWHTTDGLLFATLGLALLYRAERQAAIAAGSLCLVLAALSKQPFYGIAGLAPLYAGALHGRRAAVSTAGWLAAGAVSAALAGLAFGIAPAFVSQTTRSLGAGGGFVYSGITAYLDCSFAQCLVALGFAFAAGAAAKRRGREFDHGLSVAVGLLALFATALAREAFPAAQRYAALAASYNPYALFWIGAGVTAVELAQRRREALVLAALLLLGWTSGITWGAQGPGLMAAPLLFALLYLAATHLRSRHVRALQWLLIAGGVTIFAAMYFVWPRGREPGPAYPTADLAALSPRLSFVRVSPYTFRKYSELFAARARYGERLAVLPSMPLAYFALGIQSPLPLDLVRELELGGEDAWFARALDGDVDTVLIERLRQRPDGSLETPAADRVRKTWEHVETLETFEVWRSPRLAAPEVGDALERTGGQ